MMKKYNKNKNQHMAALFTAATMSVMIAVPWAFIVPVHAVSIGSNGISETTQDSQAAVTVENNVPIETNYSLDNIANNYTYFGKGNLQGAPPGNSANHQVGPVAVGGDASLSSVGTGGVNQQAYTYVKGNLTLNGNIMSQPAKDHTIILGETNKDKTYSFENGLKVEYSDQHIDFDKAFESIQSQVNSIINDDSITWKKIESNNVSWPSAKISLGSSYKGTIGDLKEMVFDSSTGQLTGDTVLYITDEGKVTIPNLLTNGINPSEEGRNGSGIVWLFPNATEVYFPSSATPVFGTIIVPRGNVKMDTGNYNGCLIVGGNGYIGAEGHLWNYSGTALSKKPDKPDKPDQPTEKPTEKPDQPGQSTEKPIEKPVEKPDQPTEGTTDQPTENTPEENKTPIGNKQHHKENKESINEKKTNSVQKEAPTRSKTDNASEAGAEVNSAPKTGDNNNVRMYVISGLAAGIAFIFALYRRLKSGK